MTSDELSPARASLTGRIESVDDLIRDLKHALDEA